VATVVVNRSDLIEFRNIVPAKPASSSPTLVAQAGTWQSENNTDETGIVFDVGGDNAPLLTPVDARKLAKWLTKAADELEGTGHDKKKNKHKRHWVEDDDEY
ncbi:MAG: hypothetical protein EBZ77_17295, partial [Chitinophagia bacterium]|nr:hypothetical protein [Chitinophagia bacterium]